MEAIRDLWENTPLTAAQIAWKFETTRSKIIGLANRRGWKSYNPASRDLNKSIEQLHPRTSAERLADYHHRMDAAKGLDDSGYWDGTRWVEGKPKEPKL